jgi:hypothetical protein
MSRGDVTNSDVATMPPPRYDESEHTPLVSGAGHGPSGVARRRQPLPQHLATAGASSETAFLLQNDGE